jgi:hypothetical protein
MKKSYVGLMCGVLGVCLLFWPVSLDSFGPQPSAQDLPAKAFDSYEQLWRKLAQQAADKLASGEFQTDTEVWDFLAKGQEPARRLAFEALAKNEQACFEKNGGWTREAHEKLLRSYVK